MTPVKTDRPDALREVEDALLGTFRAAGYEVVAPDIIQPAAPFLDRLGESVRSRTYVFTDLEGAELCLRPDLTIPVSRIYLALEPECKTPRRFCYAGPAFRFQPENAGRGHPREFDQTGIESFGDADSQAVEAQITGLSAAALQDAGITDISLRLGDPGLFLALLEAIEMPGRWRRRLHHQFWHPQAFHELLQGLGKQSDADVRQPLAGLAAMNPENAAARVRAALEAQNIPLFGGRTVEEIAARIMEHAADGAESPLPGKSIELIKNYLQISAPPREALEKVAALARDAQINLDDTLGAFARRNELLQEQGFALERAVFSTEFGRRLEYYSGFVFQIEDMSTGSDDEPLAGGGRYDGLLQDLGAAQPVAAMGAAVHTGRVLMARSRGAS